MSKVAVIQSPPVLLDRARTIEVALAVDQGGRGRKAQSLLVFPEAYIPVSDLDLAAEARRWRDSASTSMRDHRTPPRLPPSATYRYCFDRFLARGDLKPIFRTPQRSTASPSSFGID